MSTNARFPDLGDLAVVEVYEYYDEPVLFAAKNERDQLFLATLVQDGDAQRCWLYAPVSVRRFQTIRSGGIDLSLAFRAVEGGHVFKVEIPKDGSTSRGGWIPVEQLRDEEVPEASERLALATTTLPTATPDPIQLSRQLGRDVVTLAFDFEGRTRTEAPVGLLGQLLNSVQQIVTAVGRAVRQQGRIKGGNSSAAVQMRLSMAEIFPGSFGVELHADEPSDLFGQSPISEALERFVRLVESTDSDERLLAVLGEFKGRTASKYRQFLLGFSDGVRKVEVRWGSPRMERERRIVITADAASRAAATIGQMKPEPPTEFEVNARLVGINVRTKSYEIWDVDENQKYSGRILDDAMPSAEHATVNEVYVVLLREETEVGSCGEQETKHRLLRLTLCADSDSEDGPDQEPGT